MSESMNCDGRTDERKVPLREEGDEARLLLQKAYEHVARAGEFEGGVMPAEPPGWEWIRWDL